jgi:cytochrome c556
MMRQLVRSGVVAVAIAATAVGLTVALHATAQSPGPSRAEQLIKYRQAVYTVMGGNFSPLAAMVQGKAPFDSNTFVTRAERVAFLAGLLDEAFPPESKSGAPTRAKPGIWTERAEFDRLLDDMQAKTAELAKVAKTEDLERIRPAFGAAGEACKACHDKFRTEKKP